MLRISMSPAQSSDEDYDPSPGEPLSDTGIERPGEELPCDAESETLDAPDSDSSIESRNTSTSPQIAPTAENGFVREDPW